MTNYTHHQRKVIIHLYNMGWGFNAILDMVGLEFDRYPTNECLRNLVFKWRKKQADNVAPYCDYPAIHLRGMKHRRGR